MEDMIRSMLETQELVNQTAIGPAWQEDLSLDFHLAIMQECAEGQDHLGWKWWAKQEPNIKRAQMECVDILHFVLAQALLNNYYNNKPTKELVRKLRMSIDCRAVNTHVGGVSFVTRGLTASQSFSLISTMAGLDHIDLGLVVHLAEKLEMSFEDLYCLYSCKATLNIFRQKNGYKQGTYQKIWIEPSGDDVSGCEDNDVMYAQLVPQIDWTSPDAAHKLYHLLADVYPGRLTI